MINKLHIAFIIAFILTMCENKPREKKVSINDANVLFVSSGIKFDHINSINDKTTIRNFFLSIRLTNEDDHWEDVIGQIKAEGRESGVDIYSVAAGGIQFTTRGIENQNSDPMRFYSEKTLDEIITSFSYVVNGVTYSKILKDDKYVNAN